MKKGPQHGGTKYWSKKQIAQNEERLQKRLAQRAEQAAAKPDNHALSPEEFRLRKLDELAQTLADENDWYTEAKARQRDWLTNTNRASEQNRDGTGLKFGSKRPTIKLNGKP